MNREMNKVVWAWLNATDKAVKEEALAEVFMEIFQKLDKIKEDAEINKFDPATEDALRRGMGGSL